MRVATWNINGLRARLDLVLLWLADRRPDVVGLQELKMTDAQFPHERLETAGYRAVTLGQKAWNGVAILSRETPKVTQRELPGQEDMGARLLTAEIGGLSFTTVYCPNGKHVAHPDFPRKLAWFDALVAHFRDLHGPDRRAILCGDFNVCPASLDTWNEQGFSGRIFHTEEERGRFRRLLELGLEDAYRAQYPEKREFSWWDYRGGAFHKNQGLRLDILLVTQTLMPNVRSVEIDREYRKKKDGLTPSDHVPVLLDLA